MSENRKIHRRSYSSARKADCSMTMESENSFREETDRPGKELTDPQRYGSAGPLTDGMIEDGIGILPEERTIQQLRIDAVGVVGIYLNKNRLILLVDCNIPGSQVDIRGDGVQLFGKTFHLCVEGKPPP